MPFFGRIDGMTAKENLLSTLEQFRDQYDSSVNEIGKHIENEAYHLMTIPLVMLQQRFMQLISAIDFASIEKMKAYNRSRINSDGV